MLVHFKRQVKLKIQSRAQVGALLFYKAPIKILAEYSNYNNVFLAKNGSDLLKKIEINEYAIKQEKNN